MIPSTFWHLGKYWIRVFCSSLDLVIWTSSSFLWVCVCGGGGGWGGGVSTLFSQFLLVSSLASLNPTCLSSTFPICLIARVTLTLTLLLPRRTSSTYNSVPHLTENHSYPRVPMPTSQFPWVSSLVWYGTYCRPIWEQNFPLFTDMVIFIFGLLERAPTLYTL